HFMLMPTGRGARREIPTGDLHAVVLGKHGGDGGGGGFECHDIFPRLGGTRMRVAICRKLSPVVLTCSAKPMVRRCSLLAALRPIPCGNAVMAKGAQVRSCHYAFDIFSHTSI